jgi:hypothetical protein
MTNNDSFAKVSRSEATCLRADTCLPRNGAGTAHRQASREREFFDFLRVYQGCNRKKTTYIF